MGTYESTHITSDDMAAYVYRELCEEPNGLTVKQLVARISNKLARDVTISAVWRGIIYIRQNHPVHMISEQHSSNSTHRITKNQSEVISYARRKVCDWATTLLKVTAQVQPVVGANIPAADELFAQLQTTIMSTRSIMPKTRCDKYDREILTSLGQESYRKITGNEPLEDYETTR